MKKRLLILFIILIVGISAVCVIKNKKITRPDTDYIATIYHSEMLGMDAGWQYIYYFYPDRKNEYIYIKSESEVTEAGASDERNIEKGVIKTKNDFVKIEKNIENDKNEESQQFFHYTYINGNEIKNLNSSDELADCLFEND